MALFPGVSAAQTGSPPVVAPLVIEQAPAQELPRTGTDVVPMIVAGVALLLVGTLLVVSVRRRRSATILA